MRFLFVTETNIDFIIMKIVQEGHDVKIFTTDSPGFRGFIDKSSWVRNWKPWTKWANVIVFDGVKWGPDADYLRRKGKLVIGGSEYTDKLENDREFGQKELKRAGMKILKEVEFNNPERVIKYIKKILEDMFSSHARPRTWTKQL